jgi:imidazolonepropionase-like amidohydrolase
MGKLANKGVKIIAGTDYPNPYCFPGFSLHDELELMVEGGMTSLQALQAATINPAIFQKKEAEFGTISSGKTASLVLLNANPLEDINNSRQINTVILRGKIHDRAALDGMLEQAKKSAGRGN